MADLLAKPDTQNEAGDQPTEPVASCIRDEWHWVKQGIEEILAEQPQLTFTPEDVYAACVNGEAVLWVAPEGFVVNTADNDMYSGKRTFFVWLAWAKQRGQNCVLKYYPFFERIAKEYGFDQIEVRTPISELEGYLISEGWRKDTVVYTRGI